MPNQCPICFYLNPREVQLRETRYGTGEVFTYLECTNCNSLRIKEVPADLGQYYRDAYYSFETITTRSKVSQFIDRCRISQSFLALAVRALRPDHTLQALAPLRPPQHILDVGCGSGQIVYRLRSLGFDAYGIDPFVKSESAYVKKADLSEITGEWDVILLSHSLEHMPDQIKTLQRLSFLLAEGGKIVVRIPVLNWAWQHYGPDWVELDAPRHLFLHSHFSFQGACSVAGLKIERSIYDSTNFEHLASQYIAAGYPLEEQQGYGRLESLRTSLLSRRLNRKGAAGRASFVLVNAAPKANYAIAS